MYNFGAYEASVDLHKDLAEAKQHKWLYLSLVGSFPPCSHSFSSLTGFRCCCTFLIPKTESSAIFISYRSPPNRALILSWESLVLQRCKFLTQGSRAALLLGSLAVGHCAISIPSFQECFSAAGKAWEWEAGREKDLKCGGHNLLPSSWTSQLGALLTHHQTPEPGLQTFGQLRTGPAPVAVAISAQGKRSTAGIECPKSRKWSLEVFKRCVDEALGTVVQWWDWQCRVNCWTWWV